MKKKPKAKVYGWIKKYCSAHIRLQNVETYLGCFTCMSCNVIKYACKGFSF